MATKKPTALPTLCKKLPLNYPQIPYGTTSRHCSGIACSVTCNGSHVETTTYLRTTTHILSTKLRVVAANN